MEIIRQIFASDRSNVHSAAKADPGPPTLKTKVENTIQPLKIT